MASDDAILAALLLRRNQPRNALESEAASVLLDLLRDRSMTNGQFKSALQRLASTEFPAGLAEEIWTLATETGVDFDKPARKRIF